MADKRKKYEWKARYLFDSRAILKDYKMIKDFREEYGISRLTYFRGIANREKYEKIPDRYLIDTLKVRARIWLGDGVILAKNKDEATHSLEIKNGEVVFVGGES